MGYEEQMDEGNTKSKYVQMNYEENERKLIQIYVSARN